MHNMMMCPPHYLRSYFIAPSKMYYCLSAALNETATQVGRAEMKDPTMGENLRKSEEIKDPQWEKMTSKEKGMQILRRTVQPPATSKNYSTKRSVRYGMLEC
mmetsp:Transcript_3283/g.4748  ORF Transcript_3283/g.4748 Transcript_3283/m.4748 type:complete len:102 (+) Transcript_3283:695-1000(+)